MAHSRMVHKCRGDCQVVVTADDLERAAYRCGLTYVPHSEGSAMLTAFRVPDEIPVGTPTWILRDALHKHRHCALVVNGQSPAAQQRIDIDDNVAVTCFSTLTDQEITALRYDVIASAVEFAEGGPDSGYDHRSSALASAVVIILAILSSFAAVALVVYAVQKLVG